METLHALIFDYTLRNVALGSTLLGVVSGVLGAFAVLRRQALIGDALAHAALPGIAIRALPVAPRQIPYYAGTSYFELDRSSPYWAALARSGGVAIHITGEVPGLELECWAIRS